MKQTLQESCRNGEDRVRDGYIIDKAESHLTAYSDDEVSVKLAGWHGHSGEDVPDCVFYK